MRKTLSLISAALLLTLTLSGQQPQDEKPEVVDNTKDAKKKKAEVKKDEKKADDKKAEARLDNNGQETRQKEGHRTDR